MEKTMAVERQTVIVTKKFSNDGGNVYDGFLDPAMARRFLFATPAGEMVRAEMDANVGGKYTVVERRDGVEVEHTGEFVELIRPSLIVFTLSVPLYSAEVSTVRVEIAPAGEGCEVTLRNTGVPAEYAESTSEGWARMLVKAEEVLGE
jgi:uncharacterized protein YndB with AHSA1/START domain